MTENKIFDQIKEEISNNEIVLYMKGTADFPQCGFSSMVVGILQTMGLKFKDVNVLVDAHLRQGIKDFSDWPTVPQLYIGGEFIGGCDIVRELYETGELTKMLKNSQAANTIENSADITEENAGVRN